MNPNKSKKGFTLVELLIVLAIIGILTSIVMASTSVSRAKARDTKRISDMKEIQLALAVYYDVYRAYPANLNTLVTQGFAPAIPTDPLGGVSYEYTGSGTSYCIGVKLEDIIPNDSASCTSASPSTANYKAQPLQ